MTTSAGVDLRSIAVDLNNCPTVGTRATSILPSVQLEKRDYSELLRKLAGINVLSLSCSIVCLLFDLIFTLITLGMGATNQSSCPMEPRIPIYLIVLGSMNLVSICLSFIACSIHYREKDNHITGFCCVHCSGALIILIQLFNFIWLIIGSIWVFKIFNDVQYTEPNQRKTYCQANIYQFSIVSVILQYVLPIIFCCCKNIPFRF